MRLRNCAGPGVLVFLVLFMMPSAFAQQGGLVKQQELPPPGEAPPAEKAAPAPTGPPTPVAQPAAPTTQPAAAAKPAAVEDKPKRNPPKKSGKKVSAFWIIVPGK